jgi:hypothetical protein
MAVKIKDYKLLLELDGGDLSKLNQVIDKWQFKDYQSFIRFAVSVFLLSDGKSIVINNDGINRQLAPALELLR